MEKAAKPNKKHPIFIDKQKFEVESATLTGEQLRSLPSPPIGDDRDLYQEVPGGEDELIESGQVVKIKNGMHFFTVPKTINPGA
jgi:hypothetical protein